MATAEEELCQIAFDRFLRLTHPAESVLWDEGIPDPPDFWLRFHARDWAVEVTSIQWDAPGKKKQIRWEQSVKFLNQLAGRATVLAQAKAEVRGRYLISFDNEMEVIQGLHSTQLRLVQDLAQFIIDTQGTQTGERRRCTGPREPDVTIVKVGFQGWDVQWMSTSFFNADGLLSRSIKLIEKALEIKRTKLTAIPKPWILLIFDKSSVASMGLNSTDGRREARTQFADREVPFHTIFVVPAGEGHAPFVLCSEEPAWQGTVQRASCDSDSCDPTPSTTAGL